MREEVLLPTVQLQELHIGERFFITCYGRLKEYIKCDNKFDTANNTNFTLSINLLDNVI